MADSVWLLIPPADVLRAINRWLCVRHPEFDGKRVEKLYTMNGVLVRLADDSTLEPAEPPP